ncbi:MAG: hypothetical protein GTN88_12970 [Gammaproteobacteria bacterium]|nr:hypothetical protein [Gammaproteobacteria bacterium]
MSGCGAPRMGQENLVEHGEIGDLGRRILARDGELGLAHPPKYPLAGAGW